MKVFSLIFAVISLITFSDAHPGGLDANGGHKGCRYYRACKGYASDTPSSLNCKI